VALSVSALALHSPAAMADDEEAKDILRELHRAYATIPHYKDRGAMTITIATQFDTTEQQIAFLTAYSAPSGFRYQQRFQSPGSSTYEHVELWLEDGEARIWGSVGAPIRDDAYYRDWTREDALLEVTRAAGGMSNFVPRFLLAQDGMSLLFNLRTVRIEGMTTVRGAECYFVTGRFKSGDSLRLWIGADDMLLRRAEYRMMPGTKVSSGLGGERTGALARNEELRDVRVTTVIDYEPRIDEAPTEHALVYVPEDSHDLRTANVPDDD
jgi:hypothetical protein